MNMNSALINQPTLEASPRSKGKIAGAFYLLTILTGVGVLVLGDRLGFVIDVIAAAFYVSLTALFYALTRGA
jgi:hypothetical protein